MAVLLLFVALIAPGIAQNTYYSSCPPSPSPSGQCACDINYFKRGYLTYASPIPDGSPKLDNVCYTFFPVSEDDPCTFVAYFATVYIDGSTKFLSFLVTCNATNQFIFTSPRCSFLETQVGKLGQTILLVRTVIRGDCSENVLPTLGASSCPNDGSSGGLDQANQIFRDNGYGCSTLYELPKLYPSQCVTSQACSDTGGYTANCPSPCPCTGSGYPSYSYNPSSYSYSPPSNPSYSYSPPQGNCPYSK